MGGAIFSVAAVVEIVLLILRITTKSCQIKAVSLARLAMFAGFVLLSVFGVLVWGARYYAFAALLLLMAAISAAGLIIKRPDTRAYKTRRVVLQAVGMLALWFLAAIPAMLFPQHSRIAATGQFPVQTAQYSYTDESRIESYADTGGNRWLNVQFWYPENHDDSLTGACPLVVFSHGAMGIKTSNESLFCELASRGYVVCSIDHTYQCLYTVGTDGGTLWIDAGFMQELNAEDPKTDIRQSFAYYTQWMTIRTTDIEFVLDTIFTESDKDSCGPPYRLVDPDSIGMMGHSLGGSAALGVGRRRGDIDAVIALESPFMCDIEGVEDGKFTWTEDDYPVPILNIYSDSSWSHLSKWPQYAANQRMLDSPGPDQFNLHIEGIGHLALTDLSMTSPFLTRMLDGVKPERDAEHYLTILNKNCIAFFDSYLKEQQGFVPEGISAAP